MLSDEEKREYEELKSLLYTGTISQYGKRKLIDIIEKQEKKIQDFKWKENQQKDLLKYKTDEIEKQQKEIEELKEKNKTLKSLQNDTNGLYIEMTERKNYFERELQKVEDKIKAKIEEIKKYKDLARDSIEERIVIADSDSLNYGRKEAHEKDIEVLQSLLEKE